MTVYNEKSKLYRYQYERKKLKRVPLDMQMSEYDEIKQSAEAANETVNGYIKKAIKARIAAERSDTSKTDPPEKS